MRRVSHVCPHYAAVGAAGVDLHLGIQYMLALVFASKQNLRTISLGMYALKDSMMYTSNWGGLFAAIVIMLIPTIIIFLTLQKYVIQGLTLGAVKG